MNQLSVSPDFAATVRTVLTHLRVHPDEAVRFMLTQVPIYSQTLPDYAQVNAGGCLACTYLGLWADAWPGYPRVSHGMIWLFEHGIRAQGGNLFNEVMAVVLHEMDHALGRDHVLEALRQRKAAAALTSAADGYAGMMSHDD